jgi:hypothetical protein
MAGDPAWRRKSPAAALTNSGLRLPEWVSATIEAVAEGGPVTGEDVVSVAGA